MIRRTLAVLVLASLAFAASVSACPNCKDAVADDQAAADATGNRDMSGNPQKMAASPRLADGFNYSVLLMLAVPYTLLGVGVFTGIYLLRKNAARVHAMQAAVAPQRRT